MNQRGNYKISLNLDEETVEAWIFKVVISHKNGKNNFIIELDKNYHRILTSGSVLPLVLIQESMFFLLEREYISDTNIVITSDFCVQLGADFTAHIVNCLTSDAPEIVKKQGTSSDKKETKETQKTLEKESKDEQKE